MSANRTKANATRAIATREAENIQSPAPENNLPRMVADVFAAAARLGAVGSRDPFEAAVSAYMSCNLDMPHDEAARAVAEIICHRW
jgi:hypothetical protein